MKFSLIVFSLLLAFNTYAFEFSGKVVGVSDGDTITVLYGKKEYKIRFLHIDCPESSQAFGTKAKQTLSSKIFGKTVTVKWKEKDRYERILGDIYIGQRWINAEMVQEGMAWHYNFFSKDATIAAAQTKAKASKIGIWSQPNPVPPWDFRKGKGTANRGPPEKGTSTTKVFTTKSGKKYHRDGCNSLSKSKFVTILSKAKAAGYAPCKSCNPPH